MLYGFMIFILLSGRIRSIFRQYQDQQVTVWMNNDREGTLELWNKEGQCLSRISIYELIGISPEDLPRVFEQSYTGLAGRFDKKASGIGLYLCKRACDNLGHGITIESIPGEGTTVRIDFSRRELPIE